MSVALTALLLFGPAALAAGAGKGAQQDAASKDGAMARPHPQTQHHAAEAKAERGRKTEKAAPAGERDTKREEASERAQELGAKAKNPTAEQMQERRDQRKEIQQEYRQARTAGDAETAQKKPWWKFWDSGE